MHELNVNQTASHNEGGRGGYRKKMEGARVREIERMSERAKGKRHINYMTRFRFAVA